MKQEKNKIHKKRLALGGFSWHKRQGLLNSKQKILSKAFACEKIIKCLNPFMCQESAKITIFVIVQDTKVVKYYVAFEKKKYLISINHSRGEIRNSIRSFSIRSNCASYVEKRNT